MKLFNIPKSQNGFTIIELLIATVVFSIVLVVVLAAFVQTSRIYYKGVNMNNTQEDTRTITQDLSDDIKFASSSGAPQSFNYEYGTNPSGQFCIGNHRYSYQLGQQVGGAVYGLKRDTITGDNCPAVAGTNSEEMLDSGMQLNAISINCLNGRCVVGVHVVFYGSDNTVLASSKMGYGTDQWRAPDAECTGGVQTSQFCAVADYNRTISLVQG